MKIDAYAALIKGKLELDLLRRSPPAGLIFIMLGIACTYFTFFVDDIGWWTQAASIGILIGGTTRFTLSTMAKGNPAVPRWLIRWHLNAIILNSTCWGIFFVTCLLTYPPGSYLYMLSICLSVGVCFGGIAGLAANHVVQTYFFFMLAGLPPIVVLWNGYRHGTIQNDVGYSTLFIIAFIYAFTQGRNNLRDIKDRFRNQAIVQSQRDDLNFITNSLPGFMVTIDQEGLISESSDSAKTLFGPGLSSGMALKGQAGQGTTLSDLQKLVIDFQNSNDTFFLREIVLPINATERWFLFSMTKTTSEEAHIICYGSPIDELIDARRQVESERLRSIQSSRLASLGQMAAGVAHEINNPMAIINGHLSGIQMGLATFEDPKARLLERKVEKAEAAIYRVKSITGGLLFFAKDSDDAPFEFVDLAEIVDEAFGFCSERFRNSGATLVLEPGPSVRLRCRRTQVLQVLLSLLNNSFDAISDSSIKKVRIGWVVSDDKLVVEVVDTGSGITELAKTKLFEPFFTTKELGKGVGLGLSISKGIVESHGGDIQFESTATETVFRVRFQHFELGIVPTRVA